MKRSITISALAIFFIFKSLPCFSENISIVSWNLQCFFDSQTDGIEYREFIKSKYWNQAAYEKRLDRLCESIKKIKADIFVFEEIENKAIIMDISNKICDFSFNQKKNWNYATFSKNPGDSIGCAVLSRFPITEATVHNLDIRSEDDLQPSMRPIMKLKIDINKKKLNLLVNHWKSKSGGEEKSDVWREWQEKLLEEIFLDLERNSSYIVACGDFNKDIEEFYREDDKILLGTQKVQVQNPWYKSDGSLVFPGSYYYKEKFERIDNFFISQNLKILDFYPLLGEWSLEEGIPYRYQIQNGQGYSDHLPIFCLIEIN